MSRDIDPAPRVHLVRVAEQPVQPWRNGGGSTRQVAIDPPDAEPGSYRWRVSIAQVGSDGPFSPMPGIDRCLWLLRGNGMRLQVHGRHVVLDRNLQRFDFPGETPIVASLIDGPCEDLNVMTSRGAVMAQAEIHELAPGAALQLPAAPQRLVVVLTGTGALADGETASAGEAVRIDGVGCSRWHGRSLPSLLLVLACWPRER